MISEESSHDTHTSAWLATDRYPGSRPEPGGAAADACSLPSPKGARQGSSFSAIVPLEDSSTAAAGEADIADQDLHFHDLRGTAATKFYIAGLSIRVIAAILA